MKIPDSQEEALEILSKIDSILLHCDNSNDQHDAIKVLEFYMKYIDNFKNKFNFEPVVISQHCKELFKEDMDYNIVPDSEEEANKKFVKMMDLLESSQKIDDKCEQSIDLALGIYVEKMLEKYPVNNTSTPSSVPDNNTSPSGVGPDNNTSTPSSVPDNNTSPSGVGPDNNTSTPSSVPDNNTSPSGVGPDNNTSTPSSVPDNNTSPSGVGPDNNTSTPSSGPDNNTSTPSSGPDNNTSTSSEQNFPNTIDNQKIIEIFNSIQQDNNINQTKLIKFLISKTNDNAMLVRHVIGFDEPLTMTDIRVSLGQEDTNVEREDWKKKFSNIFLFIKQL